jgi:hypothetical protein
VLIGAINGVSFFAFLMWQLKRSRVSVIILLYFHFAGRRVFIWDLTIFSAPRQPWVMKMSDDSMSVLIHSAAVAQMDRSMGMGDCLYSNCMIQKFGLKME